MGGNMKELTNSDLISINGGADGDFAELHGFVVGAGFKAALDGVFVYQWYKKLKENGWI
ncbi:hypothetical protein A33Q_0709 [Indibacter alkaliphilus LW1]|jgi:hypothetical protein|uniref:Uncharacterized protein n=2 Tax=Indibacter TaxID=647744 RepID=S2E443_INDAL|nr:hypothetical protein A33Q_0709 [Indibacter alkaliphilus LW1]